MLVGDVVRFFEPTMITALDDDLNVPAALAAASHVAGIEHMDVVRTMLDAARTRDRLRVVADQKGCPTAAADLADAILAVAERVRGGWRDDHAGVFHAAGEGWTTWHGLAEAVFQQAARHAHPVPVVDAIATADWPTPARRPPDSRLDCAKLARVFDVRLPPWRESLARTVDESLGVKAA